MCSISGAWPLARCWCAASPRAGTGKARPRRAEPGFRSRAEAAVEEAAQRNSSLTRATKKAEGLKPSAWFVAPLRLAPLRLSRRCADRLRAVIPEARAAIRIGVVPAHARSGCRRRGIGGSACRSDEADGGTGSDRAARSPAIPARTRPAAIAITGAHYGHSRTDHSWAHHGRSAIAIDAAARSHVLPATVDDR